jgi:hypothetical protein
LSASKGSPDRRSYGLSGSVTLGTEWKRYVLTFGATETVTDARIQFLVSTVAGRVWIDGVTLTEHPPEIWRRDFTNGIGLLNAARKPPALDLGPGFQRLKGDQAARHEYVIDDSDARFAPGAGPREAAYDSGQWKAAGPFYHNWGRTCRRCDGSCAPASWDLALREDDTCAIAAWWAVAPGSSWSRQATFELVVGGKVVASKTVDQSADGEQWRVLFTQALRVADAPFARVRNQGAGAAIADAFWVRSAARYNDGSTALAVTLEPLDGIVLKRVEMPPAMGAGAVVDATSFLSPIAKGSWASVFGTNLASSTRKWTGTDFQGQAMRASLHGTRVQVNRVDSAISYVSPKQVNFQAPTATAAGRGWCRW